MFVDADRHAGVTSYTDLFPYMTGDWRKHFERQEWIGSINLGSNHIRVSDRFRHPAPEPFVPPAEGLFALVVPHQGLTVNGWADRVAARAFLESINSYAEEHWTTATSRPALLASPHDPQWSAAEIRRRAATGRFAAVALPLAGDMLGSRFWDPVYAACVETDLPLVVHFSGVEGHYLGAPALSGGIHRSAFSRLTLMPHLAESNIASFTFEGGGVRFPGLRILFGGFGFTWLPSLLWRLDREWRTFRHDVPWVVEPPSEQVLSAMYFTSFPVAEAADRSGWEKGFPERLRERVVFGSHAPFGTDTPAEAERVLGPEWAHRLETNGTALLGAAAGAVI